MRYGEIISEKNQTDIDLFEMANLDKTDTGIAGIIFVSTQQSSHGPRVKFYNGRPGRNAPCMIVSISSEPQLLKSNLPEKVTNEFFPKVSEWVNLNNEALMSFWNEGHTWIRSEVDTFFNGLTKVGSVSV